MPRRRLSSSSSPLLNPPLLIILLPIFVLIFLFFALPPFLSLTTQIFRPNYSVKKSWDSFNILLVLFAVLCGIFSRKNDDVSSSSIAAVYHEVESHISVNDQAAIGATAKANEEDYESGFSQKWFVFSDRKIFDLPMGPGPRLTPLRRSSTSYPDLRQESLWEHSEDNSSSNQFRFFDDFDINRYRSSQQQYRTSSHERRSGNQSGESETKVIPVDMFVLCSSHPKSPAPSPPPAPPPPPLPLTQRKRRRTYQTVPRKENVELLANTEVRAVQTPPPPPPLPPSPARIRSDAKYVKIERKKSNAKKEIAMVLASLYNQGKRKKKKKKQQMMENDNQNEVPCSSPAEPPIYPSTPPLPPPPPPPPHASLFHTLFKKSSKSKRVHSESSAPPLPPPPPPQASYSWKKKKNNQTPPLPPPEHFRLRNSNNLTGRPPLPKRFNSPFENNESVVINSGSQSPLVPTPPPPPPPFKMPEMNSTVRGDFVNIRSPHSSCCSSPDRDDVDPSPSNDTSTTVNSMNGRDAAGSVFCPSPDVNVKADTFIARLRDGWRLEKMKED